MSAPGDGPAVTIVAERAARRNVAFGAGLAVVLFAIASPLLREGALDVGTQIAIGALVVVALGGAGLWLYLARNPTTLVVTDDEIRLEPAGGDPDLRRIPRTEGSLRLAKEGSIRSKTLVLSSADGDRRIPLHFMDRQEIVDACYRHGWDFGD